MFTAMLDAPSLAMVQSMFGVRALLDPEIVKALSEVGSLLVDEAQKNTWIVFDNPTGKLANSIAFYLPQPDELAVQVGVVYGHRREYSFYGPDSLGRVYPNDIPRPYLIPAVEDNEELVLSVIEDAVHSAMGRLALANAVSAVGKLF